MTLPLNLEKYRGHVERFDMAAERKTELLRAVWAIMESFVDRAFGIDSVQLSGAFDHAKRAGDEAAMVRFDNVATTPSSLEGAFQANAGKTKAERQDDA